ncbi:hypothetical protein G3N58_12235 [Paraburkholderia sp. Ac-20342]|uniref:hypothetical protein n=1 Tax=Paraburkholderia sp. Ac-20342 TaxID=2703889 RepID=UPI00197E6D6F|nr:hypothetical protein [Paraburkholderia sp. Ac-20342]MBN3847592.1 hypothetical protein [Paraburkholderia sp. Ac-20342]
MARAALLMLTVYDEVVELVDDPVDDEALLLDAGAVDADADADADAEAEPDATAEPVGPAGL